jgi:uncharacterized membrane protein SirB2
MFSPSPAFFEKLTWFRSFRRLVTVHLQAEVSAQIWKIIPHLTKDAELLQSGDLATTKAENL